jgi:hypothetical protein
MPVRTTVQFWEDCQPSRESPIVLSFGCYFAQEELVVSACDHEQLAKIVLWFEPNSSVQ